VSEHLLSVFQGLLNVVFRIDKNLTVTLKVSDEKGGST
jgi:hypothetical protein